MTIRAKIRRTERTLTIGTMLVALTGLVTLGVFRGAQRTQAHNPPPPVAAQPYELPLRANDLAVGERFNTFVHKAGIQAEGKDIGARRRISDSNWSPLKFEGAERKLLTNWVDYGKPFYAMAPGTVIACWRNAPNNIPGSYDANIDKIPGGGNHLWVRQDDGVVTLYAHAQPGSIPESLCPHNATLMPNPDALVGSNPSVRKDASVGAGAHVTTGQFLGRIGNSGQSEQGPHLHVHMEKDNKPVVMKFSRGLTTSYSGGQASFIGPWKALDGNAMPKADILFWPPRSVGTYTLNGTPGQELQGLVDHLVDSGEMPEWVTCKSDGDTYSSKWVPSTGKWIMRHGMSFLEAQTNQALFTSQGYKRTSSYTCGSVSVAVWWKA